jgi:hypothetical protein
LNNIRKIGGYSKLAGRAENRGSFLSAKSFLWKNILQCNVKNVNVLIRYSNSGWFFCFSVCIKNFF